MNSAVEVIKTKRDGQRLSDEQIRWFIANYAMGKISHEQAAALCMSIFFRGMEPSELTTWTDAMIASGTRRDLSTLSPTVDKHSTGGVGDKISLILCPLVASFGVRVPQLSGRGLGHTGGTLDKLEAIAGWRAKLSPEEYMTQMREVGGVICAAGDDLAPADKVLYALRDITATVESIPLISSSIMSKKIAEGTDALVLDVKVGSGAFMKTFDRAQELGQTMVGLGERAGVRTRAVLTDMTTPLGLTAGNAIEVQESIEVLQGGGPGDIVELTVELAREMLDLVGVTADPARALTDGSAYDKFVEMIEAQGGDLSAPLPKAHHIETVTAEISGFVSEIDALSVGEAAWKLGAGRASLNDVIDQGAGVVLKTQRGVSIQKGQLIAELHTNDPERIETAKASLRGAFCISDQAPEPQPLVLGKVGA